MTKPKKTRAKRANVTISKTDYIPGILKKLDALTKSEAIIGVHGDEELAMLAGIHEFGSLSAGIPARSFVGTGKRKAQAAIGKLAKSGMTKIILRNETAGGLLDKIGELAEDKMLKNFDKLRTPPLSPVYVRRKGNKKILVEEQNLRDSITFDVVPVRGRSR